MLVTRHGIYEPGADRSKLVKTGSLADYPSHWKGKTPDGDEM